MHTTREQLTWCACYQLDERLLFSTYTLLYHISPNGSNSFYLQKSCVWACVRLLWVYTTLNIQFTMKIHGENVCVCVLSLVRVDFRPKINYVFFSSGADARRYFSLFLLLHNGFFFRFFKWHCVGEYYGLLFRSLKTNDITCWLSLNKFIGFQALQLFSLP